MTSATAVVEQKDHSVGETFAVCTESQKDEKAAKKGPAFSPGPFFR